MFDFMKNPIENPNLKWMDLGVDSGNPHDWPQDPPLRSSATPPVQLVQALDDLRQPLAAELRRNAAVGGHTHGVGHDGGDQVAEGVVLGSTVGALGWLV